MAVELNIKTKVDVSNATKGTDDVEKGAKKAGGAIDGMSGSMDKFSGGAISAFKSFKAGVSSGIAAMKTLRGAIAATGIGALLIAVVALTSAFTSSEEGQNKLAKIMAIVATLTGNLTDLLADLGEKIIWAFENPQEAISNFAELIKDNITNRFEGMLELFPKIGLAIEKLLSGDFSGAAQTAVDAVSKVTLGVDNMTEKIKSATEATKDFIAEQEREIAATSKVADMRAKADKIERQLLIDKSKIQSDIAELRLKARQEDQFSADQRKAALLQAQDLENQLLDKETEYLTLRKDAQILENTFSRTNKENLDKEAQAIAAVNNQVAQRANTARQLQRELNTINGQLRAEENKIAAEKKAAEDEAAKQKLESAKAQAEKEKQEALAIEAERLTAIKEIDNQIREYKLEDNEITLAELLAFEQVKRDLELEQTNLTEAEKEAIRLSYLEKEAAANKQAADNKKEQDDKDLALAKANADAKASLMNSVFQIGTMLGDKSVGIAKGIAVAQAGINTYQGVTAALAQTTDVTPTQSLRFANAAAVGVAGLLNVKKILSTNTKSKSAPSTSSVSSGGTSAAQQEALPSFDFVNQGVGGTESAGFRNKAYVVSQDIKDTAALDARINDLARV